MVSNASENLHARKFCGLSLNRDQQEGTFLWGLAYASASALGSRDPSVRESADCRRVFDKQRLSRQCVHAR